DLTATAPIPASQRTIRDMSEIFG
ncbi:MAG: hypothetical protein QOE63_445, partial [Acidimicrobiaceae bacterium]